MRFCKERILMHACNSVSCKYVDYFHSCDLVYDDTHVTVLLSGQDRS